MEVNSILKLPHDQCCGCKLCGDICPTRSISFGEDNEGFYYPNLDEKTCVGCGLCSSKCPVLNLQTNKIVENCYVAFAKDEPMQCLGSSGGIFGVIAKKVIYEGGVVCGAIFDRNLEVRHILVDNESDLDLLYKSKYVQSNCTGIYGKIKDKLKEGRFVLFSGTPCQCNAVRNLFLKYRDHLLLIDIVCHGVPSQSLFNKTIKWIENKRNIKIEGFQFRYKGDKVKHPQSYLMTFNKNGKSKSEIGLHYQNPYYFGFQKHITLRPSCYNCKWACPDRVGDITLGDFWGIEKYDQNIKKNESVSMISINTSIGTIYFDKIKNLINYRDVPYSVAVENNGCLKEPTEQPKDRASFFTDLRDKSFDEVVTKYLVPKRKFIFDIYYTIPKSIRSIVRKIMDKRMRYE